MNPLFIKGAFEWYQEHEKRCSGLGDFPMTNKNKWLITRWFNVSGWYPNFKILIKEENHCSNEEAFNLNYKRSVHVETEFDPLHDNIVYTIECGERLKVCLRGTKVILHLCLFPWGRSNKQTNYLSS
jgi:hypothetical protein